MYPYRILRITVRNERLPTDHQWVNERIVKIFTVVVLTSPHKRADKIPMWIGFFGNLYS